MPLAATSRFLSEDRLIRSAQQGESSALGELYDRHAASLFRVAYRLTGSREDAEDVVHDVFLGLPEALRRYEERGNFAAWLKRVAVRVVLMNARSRRRRGELALDDVIEPLAPQQTDVRAEYRDIERAIITLPESLRTVFVLREIEGYSYDEIAHLIGVRAGAARVRFGRALQLLRHTLG
jgi:RNA polymerase sigma-70 factor, ECF subfamily